MRAHAHKRRQAPGTFTADEWIALLERYDYRCLACGRDGVPLTIDHIIPLSKGGMNIISNIQPLCWECNQSKFTEIINYKELLCG